MNFSNSEANNCEVGIQGAEEDKERDVDEKEVAESVLKLDQKLFDEIAVVQHLLSVFAPQSDRDTRQQGVLCEEEERIVEDENPEV